MSTITPKHRGIGVVVWIAVAVAVTAFLKTFLAFRK
jgi:hypothetical protein